MMKNRNSRQGSVYKFSRLQNSIVECFLSSATLSTSAGARIKYVTHFSTYNIRFAVLVVLLKYRNPCLETLKTKKSNIASEKRQISDPLCLFVWKTNFDLIILDNKSSGSSTTQVLSTSGVHQNRKPQIENC